MLEDFVIVEYADEKERLELKEKLTNEANILRNTIEALDEMPSHNHGTYHENIGWSGGGVWTVCNPAQQYGTAPTTYTGGGQAHNNMPPYITVYCWRRTA